MNKPSVLIVGAGPVGMVLASKLKTFGVAVRVIEKRTDFGHGSKALSINGATLKLFDSMGIADRFIAKGRQVQHINVQYQDKRLTHIDYGRLEHSLFKYYLTLPQPQTEQILAEHLEHDAQCHIERQLSLQSLKHLENSVSVTLAHDDGRVEQAEYDYVIGCDGARSMVRQHLDVDFVGNDYGMYFLLFDAKLKWQGKRDQTFYFIENKGFVLVIPLSNGLHRVVIKEDCEDISRMRRDITQAEYQSMLDQFCPEKLEIEEIVWRSSAPFYNRLATHYCEKRVFLAGDAAHLFSPIGGLGMNTGVQDANNLAWKLAGVIQGTYDETILDSYEAERRAMAEKLIAGIDQSTRLITRLDQDLQGNIKHWLPTMQNRDRLRNIWPLHYAGLSQYYENEDGQSITHVPHATGIQADGSIISSYRLVTGFKPTLMIFADTATLAENQLQTVPANLKSQYDVCIIGRSPAKELGPNYRYLYDHKGEYFKAFKARSGTMLTVRPDGYMTDNNRAFVSGKSTTDIAA